jgi:hypothetical protein
LGTVCQVAARRQQWGNTERETTTFATSPKFAHEELLRFTLSVNATKKLKGTKYRCTIYFDISQKPNTATADNIPDYDFTWTSDVLSVSDLAPTCGNSGELNASQGNLHRWLTI